MIAPGGACVSRILIVAETDEARSLERMLGEDDYELVRAVSYDEARGVVEDGGRAIEAVILDCRIDQPNLKKP